MTRTLEHATSLAFTPPYDSAALLAAHAAHAVTGLDERPEGEADAATVTRSIRLADETPAVIRVRFGDEAVSLTSSAPIDGELEGRVRRWLDLDLDPASIADAFGGDRVLAPLVAERPGLRILGHVDDFEAAAFAVLGQQVSLAAARTFQRRLVAAYGEPIEGTPLRAFPLADRIASLDMLDLRAALGLTRSRAHTLHGVAQAFADGMLLRGEPDGIRTRLLELHGIGPWTADYLALRAVGDRDAFPVGDLVLRRALGVDTPAQALAAGEAWRPLRAYAAFHLWSATAYLP